MRVKLMMLLLALILSEGGHAQESMRVDYSFHLNLRDYEEGYRYKAALFYNKEESLFIYNSVELENAKSFKKFVKAKSENEGGVFMFRYFDEKGNIIYRNNTTGEMISRELLGGDYPVQVNEDSPDYNWNITDSTKIINGYVCYRAHTAEFRGRSYTAWFTYDIPVPFGPWKFHGLPGLILEVYDDFKLVHITVEEEELSIPQKEDIEIAAPRESQIMSPMEFMEISYQWYLNTLNKENKLSPGRKTYPISFSAIEYSEEQKQFLNQIKTIDYKEDAH